MSLLERAVTIAFAASALGGCGSTSPTPADNPDATDVDAGDAGTDPSAVGTLGSPCDKPGALACAGHAQKLQLLCDGGVWKSNGVCPGAQICDTRPGPTAGSCQDPDPKCVGKKPNESFCEGAVRRTCGPDLLSSTIETCTSADHCAQGTGPHCAKCLTGKFLCAGAVLKKCKADHSDFETVDTCATEALCVDAYGKCLPPACAVGDYRCDGDILQTCRATRIDWDPVKVCPKGMCDAAAKSCRDCTTGAKDCDGNTPRSCDGTGHWVSATPCSVPTPLCKAGVCSPGVCTAGEYRCNIDTLETCNSTYDGFDPVKVCSTGLCDSVGKECDDCKTGTADCLGSTPRACDSTGHWKSLTACSGTTPVCKAGVCTAGVCLAGDYRCNVDTLELCNSTFTGFDPVKVCGAGLCDALGKECDDCKSGAASCSGSTPLACDSTGHWKSLAPCGGSTPYCTGGVCSSCLPGFMSCGGSCVDTMKDPLNCGGCGVTCGSGTPVCVGGVCTAAVTYVGSFTSGLPTGSSVPTTECLAWETFRSSISASRTYSKITIKSNLDLTGSSCTGSDANVICQALRSGTSTSAPCGGKAWQVGTCGSMGSSPPITGWEVTNTGGVCGCATGWTVRPCIGNNNWGGSNGPTCSAPSQTLTVICE